MAKKDLNLKMNQEQLLSVEDMMISIVSLFSDINMQNFKEKIEVVFSFVGTSLNLSRISINEYSTAKFIINKTHEWCNHGVLPKIDYVKNIPVADLSSDFHIHHMNNEAFIIDDISKIKDNDRFFNVLNVQDIKSIASQPLTHQKICFGFITFEDNHQARHWNEQEMQVLKLLALLITQKYMNFKIESKVFELEEQIQDNNKSQGEYLYKMSHDIRTPLGGIYNAIYLLGSTDLSIEQKDYIEIGQASVDVMSSIIDGILDLSKIETGHMEIFKDAFNLEEELIKIYRTQEPLTDEKGIQLNFEYDYKIKHNIISDQRKIRQIMHNLMNNSIKFTHQGFITIKAHLVENEIKPMIELEIEDSGIGLDEKELIQLQNTYEQNKERGFNRFHGSGLGLPVSYELVQLIGGTMSIRSIPHKGSTIKILLPIEFAQENLYPFDGQYNALIVSNKYPPISKDLLESMGLATFTEATVKSIKCDFIFFESEIASDDEISDIKLRYGNEHTWVISLYQDEQKKMDLINLYTDYPISRNSLYQKLNYIMSSPSLEPEDEFDNQSVLNGYALIVDDNRLNRIALESILTKEGMRSKSVSSGLKAIDAVKKEVFDLVFMDVQMPDMDGIETTRKIRNLGKNYELLPIIAVTANAFLNDYDYMKTSLMNDIIFKPIRVKNLNLILRKYVKATTQIRIPDELFVFDQKDFEVRFEGSLDIAAEVIDSFLVEYIKDLKKIQKSIMDKNVLQIVETTHYFKGSCSYLSGKRVVWLLSYMLDAAKRQLLDMMPMCYELLEIEISKLIEFIVEYKRQKIQ